VELNSTHPRGFIVALIPRHLNRVVSHCKTDVSDCDTGKNRIMIYGPKDDDIYVVEFMTSGARGPRLSRAGRHRL